MKKCPRKRQQKACLNDQPFISKRFLLEKLTGQRSENGVSLPPARWPPLSAHRLLAGHISISKENPSLSRDPAGERPRLTTLLHPPRTLSRSPLQIKALKNRLLYGRGAAAKPRPALTFISLVDEVKQPLRLGLELRVSVLVGVVQHAQPPVGSFQLFRGGLGERPSQRAPTRSRRSACSPRRRVSSLRTAQCGYAFSRQ